MGNIGKPLVEEIELEPAREDEADTPELVPDPVPAEVPAEV